MFLSSENYLDQLKQLIACSQHLSIAVAFWGKGAEQLLKNWQGKSLRIICNLESGATNPHVIQAIQALEDQEWFEVEIRTLGDLHAKVMLGDTGAIIGSANFSANGLGYEGQECSGWVEAGFRLGDPSTLKTTGDWFEQQWQRAGQSVSEEQLAQAMDNWSKRRDGRPIAAAGESLLQVSSTELMDRSIYLAVYRDKDVSAQAEACFATAVESAQCSPDLAVRNADLNFFDDWPDDCEEPLPKDAPIIRVYYGPRRGTSVTGIWRRIPQLDQQYRTNTGEDVEVPILGRLDKVLEWTLDEGDQKGLAGRLKPWLATLYPQAPGEVDISGSCRRLDEFLRWEAESRDGYF
ncbi:phospholipase D family protein [Azotobacter chroococcum]|uniref:phospholipase D family protein n=1 Tax=Azotobacter chroococcum TaxID=353 RepID=UPI0010ADF3C3|nr:phospholipase D family protein [Azotobacter chroococcum]TKD31044.1 hypothetical protein FCG41_23705 [Azotobacter chroococcum]